MRNVILQVLDLPDFLGKFDKNERSWLERNFQD